jgi:hypothetical protein
MKKTRIFSLLAATVAFGFVACNSGSNNTATTDTTTATTNTATTTHTSNRNYAAMADSFKTNSEAGNYLEPRTGKPYRISVSSAGTLVDENGNAVRRYVDKRTWWVYDANTGDTVGSARMEKGSLRYRGDNDRWMPYEERWRDDMDSMNGNMHNSNMNNHMDSGSSMHSSDMNNNGNKTSEFKIKTDNKKIKGDEDGVKVKNQ